MSRGEGQSVNVITFRAWQLCSHIKHIVVFPQSIPSSHPCAFPAPCFACPCDPLVRSNHMSPFPSSCTVHVLMPSHLPVRSNHMSPFPSSCTVQVLTPSYLPVPSNQMSPFPSSCTVQVLMPSHLPVPSNHMSPSPSSCTVQVLTLVRYESTRDAPKLTETTLAVKLSNS
jgi:hypothetical protein